MGIMIRNPILPGFNPDPSICRVGEDYYIATSTFEWFPGVQIHHSRDLVNWTLVSRPLNRPDQLDMRGNPDSCGIWAPCLSYADGLFWLVYTDVKRLQGNFKDAHNYIVTSPTIDGDWSERIYVNSSGFDPSLFHDEDGRKYFMNMQWKHTTDSVGGKPKHHAFDGILMQEWDPKTKKLVGEVRNVFPGSPHGLVEGPHVFKKNGFYYMTTAEGGTGYNHAVTMARARDIWGPYELHPDWFLMTSKDAPDAPLQRAGHGQYVETPTGEVYHTHLCGRPLPRVKACVLGRETGLQKCTWGADGWLRLAHGGMVPALMVEAPAGAPEPNPPRPVETVFTGDELLPDFQWLRTPYPDRIFQMTGSSLRLFGRESIGSWFEQALVARRIEHFKYRIETRLSSFTPETYQHSAGLVSYYNRDKFHYLALSDNPGVGRSLSILSCEGEWENSKLTFPMAEPVVVPEGPIDFAADVENERMQFFYRTGNEWIAIGPELDASIVSDEAGRGEHASFTGGFVGMAAFDTSGRGQPADFDYFNYIPQ